MIRQYVSWPAIACILLICLATNLVYDSGLRFFFSQDDFTFLARVARIASWADFFQLFIAPNHFYRPVPRVALFTAQLYLFGLNARAFHLVNLYFHTLNTVLVFLLYRRLFGYLPLGGLAGLLYATHHIPFLAVYWVSGIQELSATFFLLLSLHLYLRVPEPRVGLWYMLSLVTYGLALLSKEMAVTFPALLVLVEFIWARRANRHSHLGRIIPRILGYVIVLGLYLLVRSQKADVWPSEGPYAWHFAFRIVLENVYTYLCDALYVRDWLHTVPEWAMWVCLALLIMSAIFIWRSHRFCPVVIFGVGWFLIALLPVIFLSQRTYSYYAYFPLVGFIGVMAVPIARLLEAAYALTHRLNAPSKHLFWSAGGIIALILLGGWLRFSIGQIQAMEAKDPAGIISKSNLALIAITEVQTLYPELPADSTLYVIGLTDRDAWAFGHGDLFRLYYPQVTVVLMPGEAVDWTVLPNSEDTFVYQFRR